MFLSPTINVPASSGIAGGQQLAMDGADDSSAANLRPITLTQPGQIVFGNGTLATFAEELKRRGLRKVFIVTSSSLSAQSNGLANRLVTAGMSVRVYNEINSEPTVESFTRCLNAAQTESIDGVIGFGGGSPMDVAKLVAALAPLGAQSVRDVFGINLLKGRSLFLACVPTTAGTGSEVSPNAILFDEACQLKQGVISPYLVPDVACVDPLLTCSVPPAVTAATGLDALTHCIEAYANVHAHPVVDVYALEGIRVIARNLLAAVQNGQNVQARANVALGSLYGGLCLGPVNTAAVHALAYPLGSEFSVPHGVSNAVLLPHVMRYNLPAAPERYAEIAVAMGATPSDSAETTAIRGIVHLGKLMARCPIPLKISELGVPRDALPRLAAAAMTVTRLLKNNPRQLTEADALAVYESAW